MGVRLIPPQTSNVGHWGKETNSKNSKTKANKQTNKHSEPFWWPIGGVNIQTKANKQTSKVSEAYGQPLGDIRKQKQINKAKELNRYKVLPLNLPKRILDINFYLDVTFFSPNT